MRCGQRGSPAGPGTPNRCPACEVSHRRRCVHGIRIGHRLRGGVERHRGLTAPLPNDVLVTGADAGSPDGQWGHDPARRPLRFRHDLRAGEGTARILPRVVVERSGADPARRRLDPGFPRGRRHCRAAPSPPGPRAQSSGLASAQARSRQLASSPPGDRRQPECRPPCRRACRRGSLSGHSRSATVAARATKPMKGRLLQGGEQAGEGDPPRGRTDVEDAVPVGPSDTDPEDPLAGRGTPASEEEEVVGHRG